MKWEVTINSLELAVIEKNGVDHYTKQHVAEHNLDILNSPDLLLSKINLDENISATAVDIGVNITTIYNYIKKYNFVLGKEIKFNFKSKLEKELSVFLRELGVNYTQHDRNLISPYELDFFIPNKSIGIEMNGLYWHSDIFKSEDYHYNKFKKVLSNNIQLIQIWENEWRDKQPIVKKMIQHKLGCAPEKIYGRHTSVETISNSLAMGFLDNTHIQGRIPKITISYGLYYQRDLVSVMTFQRNYKNLEEWELTRFSSSIHIIGVFSKLLKKFIYDHIPRKIISFK